MAALTVVPSPNEIEVDLTVTPVGAVAVTVALAATGVMPVVGVTASEIEVGAIELPANRTGLLLTV